MKAKNAILLIILSVFFISTINAQEHPQCKQRRERIESQKVSFITAELDLTVQEAQMFWPVYNEYNKKREEIRSEHHNLMKKYRMNQETLSAKDKEAIADKLIANKLQESKLMDEYHIKFKKVLPIDKVLKFYHAEMQFKQQLLKQLKENKECEVQKSLVE